MKKLITIILFTFSMQILSKEQIDLENKKIEETVSKYPKKVLKEMKKRFFKKYGYEMKDDEDFLSPSEVKKRKDIMNEMLREGVRNPKNYMIEMLNKIK